MRTPRMRGDAKRSRRVDTFRFAMGAGNLRLSSIWSIKANNCDLYISVRNLMASIKLSIHGAEDYRRCHIALTQEYWNKTSEMISPRMDDRNLAVWTMPPIVERGATEVVSIWLPRDNQRRCAEQISVDPKKPIYLFPPAPPGAAVRFRFLESREPVPNLLPKIQALGNPIGNFEFDDGRNISLVVSVEGFDTALLQSIRQGRARGTIFNKIAAPRPGQTIDDLSAVSWTSPADGRAIHLVQLHGLKLRRNLVSRTDLSN